MIVYLMISLVGIISLNKRLKIIKEKTESLAEAHRSLIKRTEFKDIIFQISRAVEGEKGGSEISSLIKRSRDTVKECYGCHHPDHVILKIRQIEEHMNNLVFSAETGDYQTLIITTKRVIPFVETAYERATLLAKTRFESARKELKKTERFTTTSIISGAILFLAFSIIALLRVSFLQSRIREREDSLKNWAQQWQQTFDSIQDYLIITNKDGQIKLTNRKTREIFGDNIIDHSLIDVLNVPLIKDFSDLSSALEDIIFSKNGRILKIKTYPHNIDPGEKGYIIVIRDVTSEKEMEQRLIQAEKLSALSRTMATVATELHSPLTSVSHYSEVLQDLSSINKRIREIADKISASASRMSGIVGELLHFSKIPALNKRPVGFKSMIEEILKLIREGMDIDRIIFTVESEDATIFVDRTRMERAILSLISNSINRISRSAKGDKIWIKGYKEKGLFHIDIVDNGPFIPRDASLRIFEPFFMNGDRKTGLDLSISYNIVRAHGGDIIVKSTEEKTIFSIELPLN